MTATLTLRDETASGDLVRSRTLDFPTETITVRELITRRVREEAREHERNGSGPFAGLVEPASAEAHREIDWRRQQEAALEAFERNGFFLLVGERQVESLDETIRLDLGTDVTFVKLTPLVGG